MRTLLDGPSPARNLVGAAAASAQRSPWHSPVPYLFGGLAAMLGLIAFALLILACSYWKVSGSSRQQGGDEGDIEKEAAEKGKEVVRVYEEKIVVIMAGDDKPSYLAMPVLSRGPSFGDSKNKCEDQISKKELETNSIGSKVNNGDDHHDSSTANLESEPSEVAAINDGTN
ncbi:hypothetical protein SAY86_030343 [Trapa natans]|uniref:Uncharacterized protein n=1 Tax=Trapa natans TaxID=22666 RepID=A0AAN7RCQ6_TRANT|nr:hypothetical protein SAY86_030343 [Trapa natans]